MSLSITSLVRILLISFSVTFIILHLKEVLINNNTNDADNNRRNADKACEEEECHIFWIVALYITNEEGDEGDQKHYEVVHDFVCFSVLFVVLSFTLCEAEVIILQFQIIVKNFLEFLGDFLIFLLLFSPFYKKPLEC